MTAKIFVGYRTRPVVDVEKLMPTFTAPSNWKDKDKIEAHVKEKQEEFMVEAKDQPYTGTFDEVLICDPANEEVRQFSYVDPASGKPPVSVRVRNYLLKHYPKAWEPASIAERKGQPAAIIVGFDPRTFLKILGLECSLPQYNKPCPLALWYSNSDHRDIGAAIAPPDFKKLTLLLALRSRRPIEDKAGKRWDETLAAWPGPGQQPDKDVYFACEIAGQLGFMHDEIAQPTVRPGK